VTLDEDLLRSKRCVNKILHLAKSENNQGYLWSYLYYTAQQPRSS